MIDGGRQLDRSNALSMSNSSTGYQSVGTRWGGARLGHPTVVGQAGESRRFFSQKSIVSVYIVHVSWSELNRLAD